MKVVTYAAEFARPDLPVPLSPLRGLPTIVRRGLLGPGGPFFARAHRLTAIWAGATGVVALLGLARAQWRGPAVVLSALLVLYLLVRLVALAVFERRQRDYEPLWLAKQSEVLRGHAFEVLRFTLQSADAGPGDLRAGDERGTRTTGDGPAAGTDGGRRAYDLARPEDVRDLLRRQREEHASGGFSRATVEFAYRAGGEVVAVAELARELSELTFLRGRAGPGHAWIRFPKAHYRGRPEGGRRPARRAYWVLSGTVVLGVGEPASGGPAPGEPASGEAAGRVPGWAR